MDIQSSHKHFQMSRTGVRRIIKKFKESQTIHNKPGRGRKQTIRKNVDRNLVIDVNNC